jgi:hypothetical protein
MRVKYNEVISVFPVHKEGVTNCKQRHGPRDMSLSRLPAWLENAVSLTFYLAGSDHGAEEEDAGVLVGVRCEGSFGLASLNPVRIP